MRVLNRKAGAQRRRFTWNRLLWSLVYPQRRHRITFTVSGLLLTLLALALGTAAYNSANNILFIALSLLLACLILSGVLSWLNFSRVSWRLQAAPPWRAGMAGTAGIGLENRKRFLPTYGLWFEVALRPVESGPVGPASTVTASGRTVRAALARAKKAAESNRLHLRTRLDPGGEARVEWPLTPPQRGRWLAELRAVGSLFPFGFIGKSFATDESQEIIVWPAPVEYRRHGGGGVRRQSGEEQQARAGSGGDLLALRRYAAGDSHRLIHWKASARTGRLLVRQFAADTAEGYFIRFHSEAARWGQPEQFELGLSLAATLAEDWFRQGRLAGVALDDAPLLPVRSVRDLESWLDRLAVLPPLAPAAADVPAVAGEPPRSARQPRNLVHIAPDGARGVAAYLDGEKTASA
jgi:uncharacterized protein (DUF58 family)